MGLLNLAGSYFQTRDLFALPVIAAQTAQALFIDFFDDNLNGAVLGFGAITIMLFFCFSKKVRPSTNTAKALIFITVLMGAGFLNQTGQKIYWYITIEHVMVIYLARLVYVAWVNSSTGLEKLVMGGCFFLLTFTFINDFRQAKRVRYDLYAAKEVSNYLSVWNKTVDKNRPFAIAVSDPTSAPDWETPTLLYFLEQAGGRRSNLVSWGNNVSQFVTPATRWFVVCRDYSDDLLGMCRQKFEQWKTQKRFVSEVARPLPNFTVFLYE